MKKVVSVTEVDGEGLVGLLGERVLLMCNSYFYTGILEGVNQSCVLLKNPSIVYETGDWSASKFKDAQRLPGPVYVQLQVIEAFMKVDHE